MGKKDTSENESRDKLPDTDVGGRITSKPQTTTKQMKTHSNNKESPKNSPKETPKTKTNTTQPIVLNTILSYIIFVLNSNFSKCHLH